MFRIMTAESAEVVELPETKPPPNVANAFLALRGAESIKEQVMKRPTFFRHYGGVMVDWTYLKRRDTKELSEECNWIDLQQLKVIVDISSGFNLFPDLRLVNNDPKETARTDAYLLDVFEKMKMIGAKTLIIAPSRLPETNMSAADAVKSMKERLSEIAGVAARYGVTLHLRNSPRRQIDVPEKLTEWSAGGKIKPAVSLAALSLCCERKRNLIEHILAPGEPKYDVTGKAPVYLLSAPGEDENKQLWSLHRPISVQTVIAPDAFRAYLKLIKSKNAIVVYDAIYADVDEEYRDAKYWEEL
jgi:hypothetical protein